MNIQQISNYANFTGVIKYHRPGKGYKEIETLQQKEYGKMKKALKEANDKLNKTDYDVYVQSKKEGFNEDRIFIMDEKTGKIFYELDTEGLPVVSEKDERIALYPIIDSESTSKHPRVGVLYESPDYRRAEDMVHEYRFNNKPLIYRIHAAVDIATKPIRETM